MNNTTVLIPLYLKRKRYFEAGNVSVNPSVELTLTEILINTAI